MTVAGTIVITLYHIILTQSTSLMEEVAAPGDPLLVEEISDSDEERDDDDMDDCDLISSEDSGSDDSSDDYDEDEEGKARRPDLFPDPLSLIDHAADLNSVLKAKSIGDAIQILCPNLPGIVA